MVYVSEAESVSSPSADSSDDVSVPWSFDESMSEPPSVYVELVSDGDGAARCRLDLGQVDRYMSRSSCPISVVVSEVTLVERPLFDVSEEMSVSWSYDETESEPSSVCEVLLVLSTT